MTKAKSCRILKRLLVLMLTFALLANLAVPVLAADEYPAPYPDLKVTHTKSGYEWGALNAEKTEWGITVYGKSANGSYQPNVRFTNIGTEEKVLSFDLKAEFGEGAVNASVQVATGTSGGTNLLYETTSFENRHVEVALAPNDVLRVVSKSSTGTTIPLTVTLTNLKFVKDSSASTTFLPAENGSYTVDGEAITTETVLEKDASEGYAVEAAPAEGYQFYGWYEKTTDRVISTTASTTLSFDNDSVVTALFVPAVAAGEEVYGVEMENGYVPFIKFADAAGFSVAMGRPQVTLLKNYTLTESITIPNGVTLLVPFDDARTLYTEEPAIDTKTVLMVTSPSAYVTPSAYRTLTMASGVNITIENGGALSLSGKISAVGTGQKSYNGTPTGPDGRIVMQGSNRIDVENGGSLYAYGYISGSGSVHAKSGSKVYECFQLRNWRGGNATLGLASSDVFPVSMYYVQNIEVPLTLDAGAAEIARSAVNASSTAMGAGVTFIGAGGMFQVSNGSVTKEYHPATDRLEITLDGDASLTSIQLKVPEMEVMLPQGIDSANFALPINNNITVNCTAGSDVQIHQDISMLPGSVLNIDEGATVTLDSSTEVYVFDRDDYVGKGYVAGHDGDNNVDFIPVGYSATNGTAAIRTNADLTDAKVNVNGTVIVNGGFYTTENGGAIVSLGKTGKVVFANGAGTLTETHMATQSSNVATVVNVPVNPAWLQNGDASYVLTAEAENGDEYPYSAAEDKWLEPFHGYTIRFDANGGSGEMEPMQFLEDAVADGVVLPVNSFTRAGFDFVGWSEDPDCAVEDVWRYEGDTIFPADEFNSKDITMYAIWEELAGTYVVTFDANGGEGSMEPQVITDDVPTPLNPNTFTREDYNFIGWSVSPDGEKQFSDGQTITGEDDLYLYALWQKDHYVLTFHSNYEPDETVTQEIPLNLDSITLQPNTFTREGYVFMGWAFSPNAVRADLRDGATLGFDEDTDLYAVWEKNTFQIFFDANGGEGSMDPLTVVRDVRTPLTKNAFTREGYDFIGWATVPNGQIEFEDEDSIMTDAVEDFTLYAQWQIREFNIVFKNWDDTVLQSFTIEYGMTPEYTGTEPARDADEYHSYSFSGWTPEIVPATADATYTATFTETDVLYNIRFVDEDGTELQTLELAYGVTPVYTGENPTKEATAQYTYTFAGWNPEIAPVSGDATYTATYDAVVNTYTITWKNDDGSVIDTTTVPYGTVPSHETPVKDLNDGYVYTFKEWSPALEAVTGDAEYTAVYERSLENGYYLCGSRNNWNLDELTPEMRFTLNTGAAKEEWRLVTDLTDGEEFKVIYLYNGIPTWFPDGVDNNYKVDVAHAGESKTVYFRPNYDGDSNWHYNCIYVEPRTYTVTFLNEDGTVLQSGEVAYGVTPVYTGENPTKEATAQYTYTFAGWTPEIVPATADATYTAVYSAELNKYTVTWNNWDGTLLLAENYDYGETPAYPGDEDPARAATDEFSYTFKGWTPEIAEVTEDVTYTATYTETVNKYTIKFVNEDGTELQSSEVAYGETPAYTGETPTKEATAQYSYTFAGWSPAIKKVDGDQTYTATYSETLRSYTVTWVNEDGTELKVDTVDYGVVPTYTGATPTKAATAQYTYTFAGWTPEIAAVTGEATYTATYTAEENSYVLSFNANGGEGEMEDKTLVYGVETDLPANSFTYSDHYFMGWNTESDGSGTAYAKNGKIAITADTVLYAQWAPDGWYRDENGLQYYVEGEPLKTGWTKLDDGNWYYFYPETGYAATGYAMVPYAPAETGHEYGPYEVDLKPEAGHPEYAELGYANNGEFVFDENGVFQINYTGKIVKNGSEWWCQYGEILWHARLVTDGEYYYYGSAGGALKRSVTSYIGDTNGLLPAGTYTFDDEARIIMYNGIITMEDGKWYYENGRRTYAGLFQPEGSEDYYYAASDGRIICGQEHYATKTNGLFPAGIYTFDEEGRMLINGLYEFGGELWYFENGVKTPKGLIEWKGDYYYIKQNGAAVRGSDYYVSEAKANGLFPAGVYTFGPDGKMVIPEQTTKNGLVWEDGKLWYYVENVRTHAGLIQVDGYYYYIKSNGQAVTDMRYFVSNPNGLMDRAYHNFDDQGRMTDVPAEKNGLVEENGKLWYYENGEKAHPGLILVDGDYYYICTTGYAVADCDYFISNTNGLMEKGTYHFNADGKMVVPEPDTRTGLYEENGELVYYLDGVKTHAGLIEWEGNYYYIKSNCTAVRDCDYFVSNPNGLVAVGWYHFNADGTMVQP